MYIKNLSLAQELICQGNRNLFDAKKKCVELETTYLKLVEIISKIDKPMQNSIEMSCHDLIRRVRDIGNDLDKVKEAYSTLKYGLMDVIKSDYHESYYG